MNQLAAKWQTICPPTALFSVFTFTLLMLLLAIGRPAMAAPVPGGAVTKADDAYVGLLFKTEDDEKFLPAPLLATKVDIHVTGPVSRTRVRQYYQNPTDQWLEGVYVFPLPEKSAVDTLVMRIGDREIIGVIDERQKARQRYERAKQAGQRAALLESERPNIFTTSVANIGPDDGIIIEFEYQELLPYDAGEFRLRFPMVVGPRYIPGGITVTERDDADRTGGVQITTHATVPDADRITPTVLHPDAGAINPIDITVTLEGGSDMKEVRSHHHQINVQHGPEGRLEVSLLEGPVAADRDFELSWSPTGAATAARFFTETIGAKNYGLVMLSPPTKQVEADHRQRETIFIIDTSGSMGGTSIEQARESLDFAVGQLSSGDRFNIIQFNSSYEMLWDTAQAVSEATVREAQRYISGLQAQGGTEMAPALNAALDGRTDRERLRHVVFITDGNVGNESELFDLINARLGDSRLFTVGIGSAPNSHFMTGAAAMGRGTFTYIGSPDQVKSRMAELWRKLLQPVLTHIEVEAKGGTAIELWPNPLPDLFMGRPLTFVFRWEGELDELSIAGRIAAGEWNEVLEMSDAKSGAGIAKLWAREKISSLEASTSRGASADQVRRKVLATALAYGLVTKYTSLVAIDKDKVRPDEALISTSRMPTNLPAGWDYDSVFGKSTDVSQPGPVPWREDMMQMARAQYQLAAAPLRTRAPLLVTAAAGDQPERRVQLPPTATTAALWQLAGALMILMALMLHFLRRRRSFVS